MSHYLTVVLIEPPADDEIVLAGIRGEMQADAQEAEPPLLKTPPIRGDAKALRTYAEEQVEQLLEPYSEQREVDPYEEDCWCIESGISWARKQLDDEGYTDQHSAKIDSLREQFRSLDERIKAAAGGELDLVMVSVGEAVQVAIDLVGERPALVALRDEEQRAATEWRAAHREWDERFDALAKQAPGYGQPRPDCDECSGSGRTTTTSNPQGFWDWWVVGGRWAGVFKPDDYDPSTDPRNMEHCWLCGGTGDRATHRGEPREQQHPSGCNGCEGTGIARRHGNAEFAGDIVPVPEYAALLGSKDGGASRSSPKRFGIPYALVTPDGQWHGQGRMGWWGMSNDELTDDQWYERVVELVNANPDALAVACDLHT